MRFDRPPFHYPKRDSGGFRLARRLLVTEVVLWWFKDVLLVLLYWLDKSDGNGKVPAVVWWRHIQGGGKRNQRKV